ncbi:cytochrome P450 [Lobosporangium transversale]|uniref:Cytochrome P450 n=1 Tax=Lobosporangium transversale TaxID=64571 RepID=A0A1Y2GDL9_9FUNG|nr:cytochrome P450 [Lobosporangium transversale]ORZ07952.1 cytochrome P450 [Lobosporangium transversale]|eukprot:XP_021878186.1 cytochrome P450 [Lobosporangium transversale]
MGILSKPLTSPALLNAFIKKYARSSSDLKRSPSITRIISTLLFLSFLVKFIRNRYFHPLSHIPSTIFSGSFIFSALSVYSGRSHYFLPATHKRHGKIVRVAPNIISIADKDAIHDILVKADYPKSKIYNKMELYNQHNLFTSCDKSFHKNRRRLVAPAFGLQYLRSLEPIMHGCIQVLIQTIDEILVDPTSVKRGKVLPPGHIDVCSLINRLSLDIIGETAFGHSFQMVQHDDHPFPKQMAELLKRSMQQAFNPWVRWLFPLDYSFLQFPIDQVKIRKDAGEKGRRADLLQYLIDAQANERVSGNGETGNDYEDMISGKLTDRALHTEVLVFLIAGSETSSTTITNTLMYLLKNPKTLERLREEIDQATANNSAGALPSYDQIRNLPYLTACINESMRLRPVAASGVPREVDEDANICGYTIPKDTIVLAQFPLLHYSEEYFPQPKDYIPERWLPGDESPFPPVQDHTFYPFSAGTRNCVGKNFAMMEMRLILASIVKTYELEHVPRQRTDYVQFITTAFATESYVVKMRRRKDMEAPLMQ